MNGAAIIGDRSAQRRFETEMAVKDTRITIIIRITIGCETKKEKKN